MNGFAGFGQDAGEGVYRTGEKAEKRAGIDLPAVDWKRGDGVLDLETGVGSGKLVGELNFIGELCVRITLCHRAQRKEQQEC